MILHGDCLELLKGFEDNYFDSCNADLPAGIGFMGKAWDKNIVRNPKSFNLIERHSFVAFCYEVATELLRVMKPGAYGTIWALPRTAHWTATAFELAGFNIRNKITHIFATGFPKSYDIAKGVEAQLLHGHSQWNRFYEMEANRTGANPKGLGGFNALTADQGYRPEQYASHGAFTLDPKTPEGKQWLGWGTDLKPASEDWILIQKPISEKSIAKNVLKWGVGGLNIDACRIAATGDNLGRLNKNDNGMFGVGNGASKALLNPNLGRFPANLIFSHTLFCLPEECAAGCPVAALDQQSGFTIAKKNQRGKSNKGQFAGLESNTGNNSYQSTERGHEDSGGASRYFNTFYPDDETIALYFFTAKPSKAERNAGMRGRPVEFGELPPETLDELEKIYNGQSATASAEPKGVEKKFSTKPAANNHPTVKSVGLISHLLKLTTPPGGRALDPTMGTATGAVAALQCGFDWTGIELDDRYFAIAQKRIEFWSLPPEVRAAKPGQIFIDWLKSEV